MRWLVLPVLLATLISNFAYASNGLRIINSDAGGFYVRCTFDAYTLQPETINGHPYTKLLSNNTTPVLSKGDPELPKLVMAVAIPSSQPLSVQIINSSFITLSNIDIAPSKGSVKRPAQPSDIPYSFSDTYLRQGNYPLQLTALQDVYYLSDQAGQNVEVYPVQYDPVNHSVKIYKEIVIYVRYAQSWQTSDPGIHTNESFEAIKQNHFLNYLTVSPYIIKKPVHEEGDMLIIAPDSFMSTMQPFIQWKRRRGLHVHTATVNAIGHSATAIRKYIKGLYATCNLTYIVIAGDALQVPACVFRLSDGSNGDSDNLYGCVSGSDYYPDIIVGRFSAESKTQLQTQLDRSLYYEKNIDTSNSWLGRGLCIASAYGVGDNGEYDWQHERLIRDELLHYTYSHVQELYDGTHKKDSIDTTYCDQSGDPNKVSFQTTVDKGVGLINYTGHGTYNGVSTCSINSTDVVSLTNTNKLPMCWIVGCQVGDFVSNTCFAEAGMRATYGGSPSGWLTMLGSTVNQWWSEPMRAQDEFDTLLCKLKTYTRLTFGAISVSGEMAMNDKYRYTGYDMTQSWVCFGDPSLLIRTEAPMLMAVQHDTLRSIGTDSLTVWCNIDNAHITLVQHDSIIASGVAMGGHVFFHFDPLLTTDSVFVTITALNHVTYNGHIRITAPNGPYVAAIAHSLNDTMGNNNHRADFNEHILVNLDLKNIGVSISNNIHLNVSSTDRYVKNITILKRSEGVLYPGDILYSKAAFSFDVADSLPDGYNTTFIISITDSTGNTYISYMHEPLLAPVLSITAYEVEDTTGTTKWWLSPGQGGHLKLHVTNKGHSKADIKATKASCNNSNVTVSPVSVTQALQPGDTTLVNIPVSVSSLVSGNTRVNFNVTVADSNYTAQTSWNYIIGRTVERFETGNFSLFKWLLSGDSLWFVTNTEHYEGKYSARSGHIGNNQSSTLSIAVNCTQDDTLFFAYKVSSEHRYDSLNFLLDSTLMLHWSGEQGWSIAYLPIKKGSHLFQWTYAKDPFNSVGQDCGWIDDIIFPAFAGVLSSDVYVNAEKLNLSIYPNPANDKIHIVLNDKAMQPLHINVWNTEGQLTYSTVCNNNHLDWDVSKVTTGTYIIQCATGNAYHIEKIVVGR